MKLNVARLCLDCQEVHAEDHCPLCSSESFAFLTRWVKLERAAKIRQPSPPPPERTERLEAYRQLLEGGPEPKKRGARQALARGALGLAVFGAARLLWRAGAAKSDQSTDGAAGSENEAESSRQSLTPPEE
jgi:hypothetical protein